MRGDGVREWGCLVGWNVRGGWVWELCWCVRWVRLAYEMYGNVACAGLALPVAILMSLSKSVLLEHDAFVSLSNIVRLLSNSNSITARRRSWRSHSPCQHAVSVPVRGARKSDRKQGFTYYDKRCCCCD